MNCHLSGNRCRRVASSGSDLPRTFQRLWGDVWDRTRASLNTHTIPPRQCVCVCVCVCECVSASAKERRRENVRVCTERETEIKKGSQRINEGQQE